MGRSILLVFAIASLSALGAYTLGTYFVTYLQEVVGLGRTTAIAANFLAFFVHRAAGAARGDAGGQDRAQAVALYRGYQASYC